MGSLPPASLGRPCHHLWVGRTAPRFAGLGGRSGNREALGGARCKEEQWFRDSRLPAEPRGDFAPLKKESLGLFRGDRTASLAGGQPLAAPVPLAGPGGPSAGPSPAAERPQPHFRCPRARAPARSSRGRGAGRSAVRPLGPRSPPARLPACGPAPGKVPLPGACDASAGRARGRRGAMSRLALSAAALLLALLVEVGAGPGLRRPGHQPEEPRQREQCGGRAGTSGETLCENPRGLAAERRVARSCICYGAGKCRDPGDREAPRPLRGAGASSPVSPPNPAPAPKGAYFSGVQLLPWET